MSRKKKHEHVNHERWLVSYADFITLLFAFFVVLFASSQGDKKKQQQLAAAMQTAFTQYGVFDAHSKTPALASSGGSAGKPAPIAMPSSVASEQEKAQQNTQQESIQKKICDALAKPAPLAPSLNLATGKTHLPGAKPAQKEKRGDALSAITFRKRPDGLVLSLQDVGFFNSGSADLREDALPVIEQIAANLPPGPLRIEGHTDNVAIHSAIYASNWELSSARANAIARVLLARSLVSPASLAVSGYAEFHPIASNATEVGRAKNRRVDIVILKEAPGKEMPVRIADTTPSPHPVPSR